MIGVLGWLVVHGRQNISWWLTILIGIDAAFLGTLLAGVDDIDWIDLAVQVAFSAIGVTIAAGLLDRRTP